MLVTYRAIHSMRVHVTVPGANWTIAYEAPDKYKVDSDRFNAVVIGDDAWTLQRSGWRHLPPGTGRTILERLRAYRAILVTGGTRDYRIANRGVAPGAGHQYEFVRHVEPADHGWVWIRPDYLPSQVHKSSGSWAYYSDYNLYNDIHAPAGATE